MPCYILYLNIHFSSRGTIGTTGHWPFISIPNPNSKFSKCQISRASRVRSGPTPSRLFQQNPHNQSANKRKIFFFEEFTDFTLPYNMLLIMIDFNCSRKFIIQKLGARSFRISHSHLIIQSTINISNFKLSKTRASSSCWGLFLATCNLYLYL